VTPRRAFRALLVFAPALPAAAGASPLAVALDEVVVTARKVEERALDVPMGIQILDSGTLANEGSGSWYGLQFAVPGLVVNNIGLFGAGLSLRGVANQSGAGSAIATHLNGMYIGNASLAVTRLFDMDRVEVLKGPQGTLYGSNATGGSINMHTRAPGQQLDAAVEGAYGSYSTSRVQAHVDVPVGEAALGIAVIASQGDGYIRNSVDGRRFAEQDFWGVRVSARAAFGESGRIDVMAQHLRDDGASGDLWTPNPAFLAEPKDIRLATVTRDDVFLDLENSVATVDVSYDFGSTRLVSVTGYARNGLGNRDDCAGGFLFLQDCVRGDPDDSYDQWSEELQLQFTGNETLDGLVGAYYFESRETSHYFQQLPVVNPNPMYDGRQTGASSATALFGQARLRVGTRWTVSGGLRIGQDEQRVTTVGTGVRDSPTLLVGRKSAGNDSVRLDAAWAVNDRSRLYASVSTGFTAGGIDRLPQGGELDEFRPEHLLAWEAGLKARTPDGEASVDISAFYYDYRDMQVYATELVGGVPLQSVGNAAKARLYGLDGAGSVRLNERLALSIGVVWLAGRDYADYADALSGEDFSGNRLVRAPDLSGSMALEFEQPTGGLGSLTARLGVDYRSAHYFTPDNDPLFAQDAFALVNARVQFEVADGRWRVYGVARNLLDEDYFNQVFLQSSPGLPATFEIGAGIRL
jgi:iron complex outermembrane recepter protein